MRAQEARLKGGLTARRGKPKAAERNLKKAAAHFRELGLPFWTAVTELEHAELLAGQGWGAEAAPLFASAREIFEPLKATPWLERATKAVAPARTAAAVPAQ
jgi:hypothetical protein